MGRATDSPDMTRVESQADRAPIEFTEARLMVLEEDSKTITNNDRKDVEEAPREEAEAQIIVEDQLDSSTVSLDQLNKLDDIEILEVEVGQQETDLERAEFDYTSSNVLRNISMEVLEPEIEDIDDLVQPTQEEDDIEIEEAQTFLLNPPSWYTTSLDDPNILTNIQFEDSREYAYFLNHTYRHSFREDIWWALACTDEFDYVFDCLLDDDEDFEDFLGENICCEEQIRYAFMTELHRVYYGTWSASSVKGLFYGGKEEVVVREMPDGKAYFPAIEWR